MNMVHTRRIKVNCFLGNAKCLQISQTHSQILDNGFITYGIKCCLFLVFSSFHLHQVKVLVQLGRLLCFQNRTLRFFTMHDIARFWVTCYVHENIETPYAF